MRKQTLAKYGFWRNTWNVQFKYESEAKLQYIKDTIFFYTQVDHAKM